MAAADAFLPASPQQAALVGDRDRIASAGVRHAILTITTGLLFTACTVEGTFPLDAGLVRPSDAVTAVDGSAGDARADSLAGAARRDASPAGADRVSLEPPDV